MRRLATLFLVTPLIGAVVAPTAARSPSTTEELLSGMVTEEVEPGVYQVVNDGVRDLSHPDPGYPSATVDVTPDGGVWLSGGGGTQRLFRLGGEPTFEDPSRWPPYLEVAPDGSLWAISEVSDINDGIFSFDGEGWTLRSTTRRFGSLAVGPDGTVWATDDVGMVLLRLEDDGTLTTSEYWADVYSGVVSPDELAVSPDGDVWLVGMVRGDGPDAEALLRFDGNDWELVPGPEGLLNQWLGRSMAFGPDGTLWANTNHPADDWPEEGDWRVGGLARFDDPGWTAFTEADGVQDWGGTGFIGTDLLSVAPDGSLWMNGIAENLGCDGVAHYDGTTWTPYLRDLCVHDLDISPDGSVWARASSYGLDGNPSGRIGLYVITPEAVAGTE